NSDPRIKIIDLETNSGAGAARNVGIKKSCGNKIAFLDADDRWYSHKLKIQLQFMQERDIAICYSSYTLMDEKGTPLNKVVQALPTLDYDKLLRANYIGNLTAVYDINKLEKCYAPELRKRQDWAMWLDLVKKAGCAYGILEPLAYYRIRNNSISSNKLSMLRYNYLVYKKYLGFSVFKSCCFMLRFLFEQLFIKQQYTVAIKPDK
ncbi:MAG: glycosyltransferase family 2 protein, partial [Leeuwenhoekiella sp.]